MVLVLAGKLLRDVRWALVVMTLLLATFQVLWADVTSQIVGKILEQLRNIPNFIDIDKLKEIVFQGSGKIVETLIGGETIHIDRGQDMMSIAYVHPLMMTLLTLWGVGRAAGALAGELDRGTMELLLAQPIRRIQVIAAHLLVDGVTLPLLAVAAGLGTMLGAWCFDLGELNVTLWRFWLAAPFVVALPFAVSGTTMIVSAFGRSRGKALGYGALVVLIQFLLNVVGQLWEPLEALRFLTVFYYYQPQPMIVSSNFSVAVALLRIGVLLGVGAVGYALAAWKFCSRDLPAPL